MKDDEEKWQESSGEKPDTELPSDAAENLREKCSTEREKLTPKQSSNCAGTDLAELYQNEEDGGS